MGESLAAVSLATAARVRDAGMVSPQAAAVAEALAADLIEATPAALSRPVVEALAVLTLGLSRISSEGADAATLVVVTGAVAAELERRAADD